MSIHSRIVKPGNIIVVLEDIRTGEIVVQRGKNIVTTVGDLYYAQRMAGEAPTNDFGINCYMQLGKDTTTPTKSDTGCGTVISGSAKLVDSAYPIRNDQDALNTGKGTTVVTYKFVWDTSEAIEVDIAECIIGVDTDDPPAAILMHGLFSPTFDKTESQILRVFVNHEAEGD